MNHVDRLIADRPSAPLRRRQILDAAGECFRRHGFHATSMAEIAAAASMSVGHIYRYFGGKDDIIVAIVEADMTRAMDEMDALEAQYDDIRLAVRAHLELVVRRCADPWRAALILEIMAEAARNPKVAGIVRALRKEKFERLRAMMARAYPACSLDKIDCRVEVLGVFLESIAFKSVITPDFDCDEAVANLTGCVDKMFEA